MNMHDVTKLDINPELSDREISRRVGVSPQTVNNWRKRVSL
jgi:transposase-like protein